MKSHHTEKIISIPKHAFHTVMALSESADIALLSQHSQTAIKEKLFEINRLIKETALVTTAGEALHIQGIIDNLKASIQSSLSDLKNYHKQLHAFVTNHIDLIPSQQAEVKSKFQQQLAKISAEVSIEIYQDDAFQLIELYNQVSRWHFNHKHIKSYLEEFKQNVQGVHIDFLETEQYQSKALAFILLNQYQENFQLHCTAMLNAAKNGDHKEFVALVGSLALLLNSFQGTSYLHDSLSEEEPSEEIKYKKSRLMFAVETILGYLISTMSSRQLSMLSHALKTSAFISVFNSGYRGDIVDIILARLRANIDGRIKKDKLAEQLSKYSPGINSEEELYATYKINFWPKQKISAFFNSCSCANTLPDPIQHLIREEYGDTHIHLEGITATEEIKKTIYDVYSFRECSNMDHTLIFFGAFAGLVKQIETTFASQLKNSLSDSDLSSATDKSHKPIDDNTILLALAMLDKYAPKNNTTSQQATIAKNLYMLKENPVFLYYYRAESYWPLLTNKTNDEDPRLSSIKILDRERKRFFDLSLKASSSPEPTDTTSKMGKIHNSALHHKHYLYLYNIKALLNSKNNQNAGKRAVSFLGKEIYISGKSDGRERFEAITKDIENFSDYSIENERIIREKSKQAYELQIEKQTAYQPGWGFGVRTQETKTLHTQISNLEYPVPLPIVTEEDEDGAEEEINAMASSGYRYLAATPTDQAGQTDQVDQRGGKFPAGSYVDQLPNTKPNAMLVTPDGPSTFFANSPQHGNGNNDRNRMNTGKDYSLLVIQREAWSGSTVDSDGLRTRSPSPLPDDFVQGQGRQDQSQGQGAHPGHYTNSIY